MKTTVSQRELQNMRQQLHAIRKASLAATQRGDFRAVGKLTCEAAHLNKTIQEAEGMLLDAA